MKGEASPESIAGLENLFELNRDNGKINRMRKDVEAYEEAVRRQPPLQSRHGLRSRRQGSRKRSQLNQKQTFKIQIEIWKV